jgi:hypothetical protein
MYFSPLHFGQSTVVLYTESILFDIVELSTVLTMPCGTPVMVSAQQSQGVSCFNLSSRFGLFIIGVG